MGILTCIRMKLRTPTLPLLFGDVVTPESKVPRRNLGYRVRCSRTTATRSVLGILVVR
jgi:hypothetical protein